MKICPRCNETHAKQGTYCSRTCANSRMHSEESNLKRSISLKQNYAKTGRKPVGCKGRSIPAERLARREETRKANVREKYLKGLIKDRATLKKIITDDNGYACDVCKIDKWLDKPLTLHLDHKDGNAGNNLPANLRMLCPNCHSQTETFGARNNGCGRKARGLKTY